jgi:outer membrane protein TolC
MKPPSPLFSARRLCLAGLLAVGLAPVAGSAEPLPETRGPAQGIEAVYRGLRERAAERSPEIRQARESAAQRSAGHYTAWTRWAPRLDLTLARTRAKDYSLVTSGALGDLPFSFVPEEHDLARWELGLTLPLYKRAVHLGVQQAGAESALASAQLRAREGELDWRLRQLVGTYLLQLYRVATVETSISLANTSLREAELSFRLGQKTKVDVLRARANLVSLQARQLAEAGQRDAARDALLEYAGFTAEELEGSGLPRIGAEERTALEAVEAFSPLEERLAALAPYLEASPEAAARLERRIAEAGPEYAALAVERDLGWARARQLMAQEWPELQFRGTLSNQAPEWGRVLDAGTRSYSFSVALVVPLFSFGSSLSTYREKEHAGRAAELETERRILRLANDARDDARRIRSLRSELDARRLNREQNEEIVKLSLTSYRLGKATLVELLGSQNELIESKISFARTRVELAALAAKLAHHLGERLP